MESEKSTERYLDKRVRELGGITLKYTNANMSGYPDRIVLLPGGNMFWVELKSEGKKTRPLQMVRIGQLRDLGQRVYVADRKKIVDLILSKEYAVQSAPLPD